MGDLHSTCLKDCRTPPTASRPILHLGPYHNRSKTQATVPREATLIESSHQIIIANIPFHTAFSTAPEFPQNDKCKEIIEKRQEMQKWISYLYDDVLVFVQKGIQTKRDEDDHTSNKIDYSYEQRRGQWIIPSIKGVIPSVIRSSLMQKWKGSKLQSSDFFVDIDYDVIFNKC